MHRRLLPYLALVSLTSFAMAVPPVDPKAETKKPNASASEAAKRAQVEGGLTVELWAAEPLLANPVSFGFDEKGRCFVAETTRFEHGVPDTRGHMYWLDEDLAARTVADRVAMYKKHKYQGYEKFDDQVRMVWDSTGSGVADKSTVYTSGYNRPEDGLASGVLARYGTVYLTNIPDLYKLHDRDGDGVAEQKESLSTGYGVRVQFLGHDMHGLILGPDGKLYFSIGDRGLNVTNKEGKQLINTESGSVLRCDLDGANLELVHTGLRNPQELAFDNYGNLFTYDNNCDSGDRARWVQIVEGGDSGWRAGYQYGTYMHNASVPQGNRGPWNLEKVWHVPEKSGDAPAYIVPPLLHFGNGPAGITHYPGLGLNDKYQNHFFACDFTASAGSSIIWTLGVNPKGASFEVVDLHPFVKQMVPTDCDFGPDGAFYWSDWTGGWEPPQKGRIFKVTDRQAMQNPAVAEAAKLLAEGFKKKSADELAKLLSHPHQKVRLESQYELAGRAANVAIPEFTKVAAANGNELPRIHAVWGLGMVARKDSAAIEAVVPFLSTESAQLRKQAVRALLMPPTLPAKYAATLAPLLADPDAQVAALAAVAYGRAAKTNLSTAASPEALQAACAPLFQMLKANADQDAYTRQAAVQGLVEMTTKPTELMAVLKHTQELAASPAVRLGVALVLRKLHDPALATFLSDADPRIVTEAARGIYDEGIDAATPTLAKLAEKPGLPESVAYRALAANYRLGSDEDLQRVVQFAARTTEPDYLRVMAMKLLVDWAKPPRRDPITGMVRDLAPRSADAVMHAVKPVVAKFFAGSDEVRGQAVKLIQAVKVPDVGPLLVNLLKEQNRPASVRMDAIFALQALKSKELNEATAYALASSEPHLRGAARFIQAKANPTAAESELPGLLANPQADPIEKQMAFDVMGELPESQKIDRTLAEWLDKTLNGEVPIALQLDVREAAQARIRTKNLKLHAPLREKLAAIEKAEKAATAKDPLAPYRDLLAGGNAEKGRAIVINNSAVSCQRCHRLDGQGGDVGPVLNGVAAKNDRAYLLQAIVTPNAKIAEGFQSVILQTLDGKTVVGVLRAKDSKNYTIVTPENKTLTIPVDDVDSEKPDKSAMPDDLHNKLSKRELRDVVEFLASLKEPVKK